MGASNVTENIPFEFCAPRRVTFAPRTGPPSADSTTPVRIAPRSRVRFPRSSDSVCVSRMRKPRARTRTFEVVPVAVAGKLNPPMESVSATSVSSLVPKTFRLKTPRSPSTISSTRAPATPLPSGSNTRPSNVRTSASAPRSASTPSMFVGATDRVSPTPSDARSSPLRSAAVGSVPAMVASRADGSSASVAASEGPERRAK